MSLKIGGTIRSLTDQEVRKKDLDKEQGRIVIMNEDGEKVTITGSKGILDGYAPDEQVIVTMTRANKTLKESV